MFEFGRCNIWTWTLQYLWYLLYWTVSVLLSQRKQFIRVNRMSYIAHTFIWLTVSFVLTNHKKFIRVNRMLYIAHTFIWLTVSFVLPNHKQFIRVNHMLYIAHTFIWMPVCFVPTHRKRLIKLNCMPWIAYATKIWTVFDASVIANVLYIFDGFHTPPFAIIASHTVSRRVSDRSAALAPSCSSDI